MVILASRSLPWPSPELISTSTAYTWRREVRRRRREEGGGRQEGGIASNFA